MERLRGRARTAPSSWPLEQSPRRTSAARGGVDVSYAGQQRLRLQSAHRRQHHVCAAPGITRWSPSTRRPAKRSGFTTVYGALRQRGINYWESKDRKDRRLIFQINHSLQEIDARTGKSILTFGKMALVDLREGLGRDPATISARPIANPGTCLRESDHPWIGRPAKNFSRRPAICAPLTSSPASWSGVPHHPASRRVRLRDLAEGCLEVRRRRQHLGRNHARRETRDRLFPTGSPTYDFYGADRHRDRTCLATACSRSTRAPASACGTSRSCITIYGTTTRPRPRN